MEIRSARQSPQPQFDELLFPLPLSSFLFFFSCGFVSLSHQRATRTGTGWHGIAGLSPKSSASMMLLVDAHSDNSLAHGPFVTPRHPPTAPPFANPERHHTARHRRTVPTRTPSLGSCQRRPEPTLSRYALEDPGPHSVAMESLALCAATLSWIAIFCLTSSFFSIAILMRSMPSLSSFRSWTFSICFDVARRAL